MRVRSRRPSRFIPNRAISRKPNLSPCQTRLVEGTLFHAGLTLPHHPACPPARGRPGARITWITETLVLTPPARRQPSTLISMATSAAGVAGPPAGLFPPIRILTSSRAYQATPTGVATTKRRSWTPTSTSQWMKLAVAWVSCTWMTARRHSPEATHRYLGRA